MFHRSWWWLESWVGGRFNVWILITSDFPFGKFTSSEASRRQAPMEKQSTSGKLCRNSNLFSVGTCTESAGHMNQVTRPPFFADVFQGVFFLCPQKSKNPLLFSFCVQKSTDFNKRQINKNTSNSMCVWGDPSELAGLRNTNTRVETLSQCGEGKMLREFGLSFFVEWQMSTRWAWWCYNAVG